MRLNHKSITSVTSMLYIKDAKDEFGEIGSDALTNLIENIRSFFKKIPPDHISGKFIFIQEINTPVFKNIIADDEGFFYKEKQESELTTLLDIITEKHSLVICETISGTFDVLITEVPPDPIKIAKDCIVFLNHDCTDEFYIGENCRVLPSFLSSAASNFSTPTKSDLAQALDEYKSDATNVSCPILAGIWEGGKNGPRIVLTNKPESTMRTSLHRFLSIRLGADASVRPEHNTDETKPVDIVVNWFGSTSRALIEIKWLGKSLSPNKNNDGSPKFTEYTESRARDGYDQLADYLDREMSTDAKTALSGYLVIFDARRKGVSATESLISKENAEYYKNRNISYSKNHSKHRTDMESPVRFFLSARQSSYHYA